jgi:hypothetical protein
VVQRTLEKNNKMKIAKFLLLVSLLTIPQIGLTNASFTAQSKIDANSVSAGWWVAPSVRVTSPNGGEAWLAGSFHEITWTAVSSDPGGTINTIDIYLSVDGGATYLTPLVSGIANTGSFSWTISGPKSPTMKVKVVATDNHGLVGSDESDNIFDPAEEQTLVSTPAPSGEPESSPDPSPTPIASPEPSAEAGTPSPQETIEPTVTPEETATPTPAASPTDEPTPTPTETPTETPTPTSEEVATPSPTPDS